MDIVLMDKSIEPSDEQLKNLLKRAYVHFDKLRKLSDGHVQEWKYYNKKSGWIFKVSNKKRAMFYITPLSGKFHIGMAINEADKGSILDSSVSDQIKTELASAKKVMEGYPIRRDIKNKGDFDRIVAVLKTIGRL